MPFFIIALSSFSLFSHIDSYYPFFIAFIITVILSYLMGLLEKRTGYWDRSGYWGKYIILNGLYILNIALILVMTLSLDYFRLIKYFGGDAAGSFGMLYIPSVMFYLLLGLIGGIWRGRG
ncbi:MAG: hypothetical protein Q8M54_04855 [Desulfobaccales bacterium]|nr:hypothetical protein [Desulfobaccales bacterium]